MWNGAFHAKVEEIGLELCGMSQDLGLITSFEKGSAKAPHPSSLFGLPAQFG